MMTTTLTNSPNNNTNNNVKQRKSIINNNNSNNNNNNKDDDDDDNNNKNGTDGSSVVDDTFNKNINIFVSPSSIPHSESHIPAQSYPHFHQLKAGHALTKVYQAHHSDNNSSVNSVNSHLLQLPGIKSNLDSSSHFKSSGNDNNNHPYSSNNSISDNNIFGFLNHDDLHSEHHHHHNHHRQDHGELVTTGGNNYITPTKRSSGNSFQRIIDPDEEPINIYSFSGFIKRSLIYLFSFFPQSVIEKLILLFAWFQLELLKAKGNNMGGTEQSFSKLKKKRKSLKKKKNKANNIAAGLSSNSTAALLSSNIVQPTGPIPVAHSKSSPLVANKHQRRLSLSTSTSGISSTLKGTIHSKPVITNGNNHLNGSANGINTSGGSSGNLIGLSSNGTPAHSGNGHLTAVKDKLYHQQQKHFQQRVYQKQLQQQQQQQQKQQGDIHPLFPSTIPDQIPDTTAEVPSIKLGNIETNNIESVPNGGLLDDQQHEEDEKEKPSPKSEQEEEQDQLGELQDDSHPITTASALSKINFKHRPSITELESDESSLNSDGSINGGNQRSGGSNSSLKVTFSGNDHKHHYDHSNESGDEDVQQQQKSKNKSKMLDWNNYLNPNDMRLGRHQMSQENLMIQHQKHQQHQHQQQLQQQLQQQQQIPFRQRSDSISVLPSLVVSKPISEIRRVNSEQTLFQSSEDTLRFEANQQSKKEFEDFLRSVKDIKDVHNWLRNFSGSATKKVAIVKISRRILDTPYGIECAANSLCFMFKFGLYPIVIHGGMNDISKLPISQVVEERRMRSALLKEAIKKNGVGCSVLTPDICEIEQYIHDSGVGGGDSGSEHSGDEEFGQNDILPSGGLNIKIDSFDYDILTKVLDKGKIPIWDSVCESTEGVDIPVNSDITTFELAKRIQPYKILFACNDGGILDSDHKAIPVVYMDQDYQTLVEADHTTNRRRVQLKQMKRIVDNLPSSTTLVVTSMENVTHQLLFPRLANGTIIKKSEENKVLIFDSSNYTNIDMERLRELIENSFGKLLSTDYFDYLKESLYKLYLCVSSDGDYNGCAIVTFKEPDYIPYLCKFCVKKSAQGLGLGDLIWRVLQRDNEKLYWRSRNNNPLNPWYFQRCQGSFRADLNFTIFWYGDDKFEDGSFLVEEALKKPITVLAHPTVA